MRSCYAVAFLNAEWGLSIHAQSFAGDEERNVLVDFGFTPEVLNNNMAVIGVDPSTFDGMVLSHGHYDHFGGMVGFLERHGRSLKKEIPLYVGGEDAFCLRPTSEATSARSTAKQFLTPG